MGSVFRWIRGVCCFFLERYRRFAWLGDLERWSLSFGCVRGVLLLFKELSTEQLKMVKYDRDDIFSVGIMKSCVLLAATFSVVTLLFVELWSNVLLFRVYIKIGACLLPRIILSGFYVEYLLFFLCLMPVPRIPCVFVLSYVTL